MKLSKSTTIISLTLITLISLAVLGYGFWLTNKQSQSLDWQIFLNHNEKPKVIVYEELKTEMDTSGWLEYKNEMYGFEFKYPKDWNKPEISFSESSNPSKKLFLIAMFRNDNEASLQGAEIYSIESKNDLNKNIEALERSIVGSLDSSEKIELFNGKAFYSKIPNTLYRETPHAYVVSKQYLLTLEMLYDTADSMILEELFKKIISTFKFYD